MFLAYAIKLSLKVQLINVKVLKINGFTFKTFWIVLGSFQIDNNLGKAQFF